MSKFLIHIHSGPDLKNKATLGMLIAVTAFKKGNEVNVFLAADGVHLLNVKKEGEVIEIDRSTNRAKVKDINMVNKHVKTTKEKKGGIVTKENFIHISNLKLIDEKIKSKKTEAKK